jgi:hypothetical protein
MPALFFSKREIVFFGKALPIVSAVFPNRKIIKSIAKRRWAAGQKNAAKTLPPTKAIFCKMFSV